MQQPCPLGAVTACAILFVSTSSLAVGVTSASARVYPTSRAPPAELFDWRPRTFHAIPITTIEKEALGNCLA